jgi:hypothetical protein
MLMQTSFTKEAAALIGAKEPRLPDISSSRLNFVVASCRLTYGLKQQIV